MGTRGGLRPRSIDGSLDHLLKPKWKSGKTKTIRVPEALVDQILEITRRLDSNEPIDSLQDKNTDKAALSDAIAILKNSITPKKEGGTYDSRYGSRVKEAVEQALTILEQFT